MVLFNYRRPPWDKIKKTWLLRNAEAKEPVCSSWVAGMEQMPMPHVFFHHHLEMFVGHDPSDVGVILTWDLLPPLHAKILPFYNPVIKR